MSRYKAITSNDRVEVYKSGIELIDQGYSELPETSKNDAEQLFIDTHKMQFFFTDGKGMQVARNFYNSIEETNFNQIRSWQSKPKKAKA